MGKIKNWLKSNKKTILKSLLVIGIIAIMAVTAYLILVACGFTSKDKFIELRNNLGDSIYFWLIIGFLQVLQVIFIPISNQIITVPLSLMFPPEELWKVWVTSWASIWFSTIILYFIGKWGGKRLLKWVLGDEKGVEKSTNWLKRGWIFYPIGCLVPMIPDDIITVLAGTSNMSFVFIMISAFITRGIDTACSVFGLGFLTRFWWGWIILIIAITLLCLATFIMYKLDKKKLTSKNTK